MRINCKYKIFVLSFVLLISNHVSAQSASNAIKVGVDYRFEAVHDDLGEESGDESDVYNVSGSTAVTRLSLKAQIDATTNAKFRYHLIKGKMEEAYVTKELVPAAFFLTLGQKKVYQAGYFQKKNSIDKLVGGAYIDEHKPFQSYTPLIEPEVRIGMFRLGAQVLNDLTPKEKAVYARRNKQPASIYHLAVQVKPVEFWFQYGSYDLNHSNFMSYSLAVNHEGLNATIDYVIDQRQVADSAVKVTEANTELPTDRKKDTLTSVQVDVEYTWPETASLFLQFADYDRKQGGDDVKANTYKSNNKVQHDDNSLEYGIGARYLGFGSAVKPFFAAVFKQAKFFDVATNDEEDLDRKLFYLGVTGEI